MDQIFSSTTFHVYSFFRCAEWTDGSGARDTWRWLPTPSRHHRALRFKHRPDPLLRPHLGSQLALLHAAISPDPFLSAAQVQFCKAKSANRLSPCVVPLGRHEQTTLSGDTGGPLASTVRGCPTLFRPHRCQSRPLEVHTAARTAVARRSSLSLIPLSNVSWK